MTDILPPAGWPNVRQLETNEFASGGANGNMNEQAKSLAARSELLKQYAALPYESKTGGYALNERVQLATGDIVRSTIASNVNNPNENMTGWVLSNSDSQIKTWSGRTQEEKNRENLSLADFGCIGDGITDDTSGYRAAITYAMENNILIDGCGLTYLSTTRGTEMKWVKNATVITPSDGTIVYDSVGNVSVQKDNLQTYNLIRLGGGAPLASGYQRGLISIGNHSCPKISRANTVSLIAIGSNTFAEMSDDKVARFNIAVGDGALMGTVGSESNVKLGSRNTAVGYLAGHFNTTGYMNCFYGRNAGHNNTTGYENTAIGYSANVGGNSPIGWSGNIEMQWGGKGYSRNTAIGAAAAFWGGERVTAVGFEALKNIKSSSANVAIGHQAGLLVDSDISYDGYQASYSLSVNSTYSISDSITTVTLSSASPVLIDAGDLIGLNVTTGSLIVECGKAVVKSVSGNTFTIDTPISGATGVGDAKLIVVEKTSGSTRTASSSNILIGLSSAQNKTQLRDNVVLGTDALSASSSELSEANVLVGNRSGGNATKFTSCAGLGTNALRFLVNGSNATVLTNSTAIGANSRVSGDNQVQLGGSAATTYAFGAVQDRSDMRDKADIEAMPESMTDFVLNLNAVQGVWDMRDDYILDHPEDWTDEQKKEWWANPVKDGTRKRGRRHNWFIAQEVKELADKLGIDFAGLQDHKLIDGTDTFTIGYEEFIPPIVATIQKLSKRMDEIELRLTALEK